jgi:hypothetical protein
MNKKQFKTIGFISALILVASGCGLIGSNSREKDCEQVKTKIIFEYQKINNSLTDLDKSGVNVYLLKSVSSGVFPTINNDDIKSIIKDIANVELQTEPRQNAVQLLNIATKLNSLAVICGLESELSK